MKSNENDQMEVQGARDRMSGRGNASCDAGRANGGAAAVYAARTRWPMSLLGLLVVMLFSFAPAWSQTLLQNRDLVFAQMGTGRSIETVITVTNRGTTTYAGTLYLINDHGEDWNPTVDGNAITKGRVPVSVVPGGTSTVRITGTDLQEGYAFLRASQSTQTSIIEGNLTYFVRSPSGLVATVGILPSTEFYVLTIPFEDFATVAVALANLDFSHSAHVELTLFTKSGTKAAQASVKLGPYWHKAAFLSDWFRQTTFFGRGRVEITASIPVAGAALVMTEDRFSSLSLLPSPRAYTLRGTGSDGTDFVGEASLWADGYFVKGYFLVREFKGQPIKNELLLVYGRLVSGVLRLSYYGNGAEFGNRDASVYATSDFSFNTTSISMPYVVTYVSDKTTATGTLLLTRVE